MSASVLKKMRDMGLTFDQAIELLEAIEAEARPPEPTLSKGAERTRRWRERKAAEHHGDVTGDDHGDVTSGDAPSPPPSFPPEPPKPPTPTPGVCSTQARARPPIAKPNGFARFWEAYPNKVAKAAAEKAFVKACRDIGGDDPLGVLLAGIERAKASRSWRDGYVPHPTTWLNQGRWDDQPAEIIPIDRTTEPRPHGQPAHTAKFNARMDNLARAFAGSEAATRRRARDGAGGG